jgi:hypothetical protein
MVASSIGVSILAKSHVNVEVAEDSRCYKEL